jgi:hypothetical protein
VPLNLKKDCAVMAIYQQEKPIKNKIKPRAKTPVRASLLAMRPSDPTSSLTDTPSQAGSLPQG